MALSLSWIIAPPNRRVVGELVTHAIQSLSAGPRKRGQVEASMHRYATVVPRRERNRMRV